jgi:hypothetical protein
LIIHLGRNRIKIWRKVIRKTTEKIKQKYFKLQTYREASLMLAMFFLPFGYDALFKMIMDISGSYWIADVVFYSISGFFWLLYILFTRLLNKSKK